MLKDQRASVFLAFTVVVDRLLVTDSSVRTGTLKDPPLADGTFTFRRKFSAHISAPNTPR
jgi:hypothetical protein